jgi:hypothetical protein
VLLFRQELAVAAAVVVVVVVDVHFLCVHCCLLLGQGRADYHGPGVNLAARITDAAAAGGQVVTNSELAERIFW